MLNIIRSDLYRLGKGAAVRNTVIGILATVLLLGLTYFTLTSDGLQVYIDDAAAGAVASEDWAELSKDMAGMQTIIPANASEFGREMAATNYLAFFLLPLIITIFCADFSAGAYRNTLTYESSRAKVYLAKLTLSVLGCIALSLINLVFSWIVGGFLFGMSGFTAEYLLQMLVTLLLLFPVQLGLIGFGHCVVAFTKKSSTTVAIFLVAPTLLSAAFQMLSLLPTFSWLPLLDWNSVGSWLAAYWTMSGGEIFLAVGSGLAVAAVSTALGLAHYRKADMA